VRIILHFSAIILTSVIASAEGGRTMLEREAQAKAKSASTHAALAEAYHWQKDFSSAEREYRIAAQLDRRYLWAIVPLLDELQKWDDIITLVGDVPHRTLPSGVLGALATAYHKKGMGDETRSVIEVIERRAGFSDEEEDYSHYVLAYVALWNEKVAEAIEHLLKIKSTEMLQYAKTSPKFEKLSNNERFIALVTRETKSETGASEASLPKPKP
jgi:tetratricopeptide (TPR) repeat protein